MTAQQIAPATSILSLHSKQLMGDLSEVLSSQAAKPRQVSELQIVLPSLKFVTALMNLDMADEGVCIVGEAWSIGLKTSMIVHQQVLPLLSASKLKALPVAVRDHKGFQLFCVDADVISYADVALYANGWVLTDKRSVITSLAFEHMQKNDLHMVKK